MSVAQIGRYAIKDNPNIKSVKITDGVNTLGVGAFFNCINLQRVELSPNTTTISGFAFSSCFELAGISIPATTTTIGDSAFKGCIRMTSIVISPDASLSSIGLNVFEDCSKLVNTGGSDATLFRLPETIKYVPDHAFKNCEKLDVLYLPDNMISESQFNFMSILEGIPKENFAISCVDTNNPRDLADKLRGAGYTVIPRTPSVEANLSSASYSINTLSMYNVNSVEVSNDNLIDNIVYNYMCNRAEENICINSLKYLIDISIIKNS